jgi:hypothetical protein
MCQVAPTVAASRHNASMHRIQQLTRPLLALMLLSACTAYGYGSKKLTTSEHRCTASTATAYAEVCGKFTNIVLTDDDKKKHPKVTFTKETPKIYVFFGLEGLVDGDRIKSIWICERSKAAPPDYKIGEATLSILAGMNTGNFSLSKPNAGFPEGTYRVELYINDQLKDTAKFTVDAAG